MGVNDSEQEDKTFQKTPRLYREMLESLRGGLRTVWRAVAHGSYSE